MSPGAKRSLTAVTAAPVELPNSSPIWSLASGGLVIGTRSGPG